MIMWKLRAVTLTLLVTIRPFTVWAYRISRPTRHHVKSLRRAGIEAIRADMIALRLYQERVRRSTLSRETAEWDTIASKKLRRMLAEVGV